MILENVRKKYLSCKSYIDKGQVSELGTDIILNFQTFFERSGVFSFPYVRKRFYRDSGSMKYQISLERPKKFRFEFKSDCSSNNPLCSTTNQGAIWSNGKQVYRMFTDVLEQAESIDMAVAGATGVSKGAATAILRMLMPEIDNGCGNWFQMRNPIVKNIESLSASSFYHIAGRQKFADDTEAWINRENLLVTRILQHKSFSANEEQKSRQIVREILSSEMTEEDLENLLGGPFEDRSYTTEYKYSEVKINADIQASTFELSGNQHR